MNNERKARPGCGGPFAGLIYRLLVPHYNETAGQSGVPVGLDGEPLTGKRLKNFMQEWGNKAEDLQDH